MAEDLPKDISRPDRLDPTESIKPGEPKEIPDKEKFASMMQQEPAAESTTQNTSKGVSPMELAEQQKLSSGGTPPSLKTIQGQMNSVSGSLGDIKNQLHTKGLKLKQSQKYLLRNKLGQANDHIRSANKQVGNNPGEEVDLKGKKNPITRFLSLVSDGQSQLNEAATMVRNLDTSGKSLNAGQLLLVQVKLQKAQQELDYTSVLLGKAVDMIKTLFNVQI